LKQAQLLTNLNKRKLNMFNHISKLMALMAMSFIIYSPKTLADDIKSSVKKEVKEAASTVIRSAEREIHKHAIGFGLGQTFMLGQFEKYGDNKITVDMLYSYTASYSFDLLVNAHSSHHTYRDKEVWVRGLSMSIKARSYEFDAFSPYLLGGLGFYRPQIANDEKQSESKNTFGFNFGAGADLRLNHKVIAGVMAQYHKPFEVKQDEMADLTGSYFKLLLTMMYLF
jgi:opacity protein-like surface antigen